MRIFTDHCSNKDNLKYRNRQLNKRTDLSLGPKAQENIRIVARVLKCQVCYSTKDFPQKKRNQEIGVKVVGDTLGTEICRRQQ